MVYSFPGNDLVYRVSEPLKLYESDLVKQWLNILPGTVLDSINYGKIVVINPGKLNEHEGPDVNNAILIIRNKIVSGPIECHNYSRDWFTHNHHINPMYDKVILHVLRNGRSIEISPMLPTIVLQNWSSQSSKCSLTNQNKKYELVKVVDSYGYKRWIKHTNSYVGLHNSQNLLVKKLIIKSFKILGAGGNETQFKILAKNIRLEKYKSFTYDEGIEYLSNLSIILDIPWVKRGIRPAQQPQNRLNLAAELIFFIINLNFIKLYELKELSQLLLKKCPNASGKSINTELMGNVFIPFFGARALHFHRFEKYNYYLQMWTNLRLPNIYQKYSNRFNKLMQNTILKRFSILQGLIELDNNWCKKDQCNICPLKKKKYAEFK